MTYKKTYLFMLSACLLLAGVSCDTTSDIFSDTMNPGGNNNIVDDDDIVDNAVKELPDDENDDINNSSFTETVSITFGSSVTVSNSLEGNGVSVSADGQHVIITSTEKKVEYILKGTTQNGSVKIYSDYKFKLTMDGVQITNPNGPAVNIQSGKRVFVWLNNGTENVLTDGSNYQLHETEDMKAAFFSEGQLIFNGKGALRVNANYKHAICSDDYIRIYEGTFNLISKVSDGIHANDAVIIDGGTLNINSASDAIECEKGYILINDGDFTIVSGDEGIVSSYNDGDSSINPYMDINGGTFRITTTGASANAIKSRGSLTINKGDFYIKTTGRESEGIESKNILTINDGYFEVEAYDDCLNASNAIRINGGMVYCYSSSNDAIDSNGTLTITGGTVVAVGAGSPEAAFDCDQNMFKITGGTLIGIGGSTSTPTASACTQPSLFYGASGTQNTLPNIQTGGGESVLTYMIPRTLSQMTVVFSSPSFKQDESYVIYTGGSVSGGTEFKGLYTGADYSGGTQKTTFTTSSMVTTVGSVSGGGGNTGWPGGRP